VTIRICLLGLALVLSSVAGASSDPPPSKVSVGETAPAFSVLTADRFVRQGEEFEGSSGLVLLFATHDTADEVRALGKPLMRLAARGLNTLIIDIDCFTTIQAAEVFWKREGIKLPVRYDNGSVAELFKVEGVPFAALIDRKKVVRYLGGIGVTQKERHRLMGFFEEQLSGVPDELPALPAGGAELSFLPHCRGVRH
jgi:hypothetical protein